tara:strand:+ start:245 stop:457 length:213 start_codon:yes stop_codon:yes gene_type:complete
LLQHISQYSRTISCTVDIGICCTDLPPEIIVWDINWAINALIGRRGAAEKEKGEKEREKEKEKGREGNDP